MSEPVAWLIPGSITRDKELAEVNKAYAEPLYLNPDPRVAELEAVLRECRDVIEEAQTYCEGPQWSPSMAHDCGTAIAKIDEVLK